MINVFVNNGTFLNAYYAEFKGGEMNKDKIIFWFEISKIIIVILNLYFLVNSYPKVSIIISLASLISSAIVIITILGITKGIIWTIIIAVTMGLASRLSDGVIGLIAGIAVVIAIMAAEVVSNEKENSEILRGISDGIRP